MKKVSCKFSFLRDSGNSIVCVVFVCVCVCLCVCVCVCVCVKYGNMFGGGGGGGDPLMLFEAAYS